MAPFATASLAKASLATPSLAPVPLPPAPLARVGFRSGVAPWALLLALAALPLLPGRARASSPQAWQSYGAEVSRACLAASGLRDPRPAGERLDLHQDSGALTSALLLEGVYPQAHLAGRRGLELCLYDSRTRQARVAAADGLDQRPR